MPCAIYDQNQGLAGVTYKSALELAIEGNIPSSRVEPIGHQTAEALREFIRTERQLIDELTRN